MHQYIHPNPMILPPLSDTAMSPCLNPEKLPQEYNCPLYTSGFLRTQLGKKVCVELLVGDTLELRTGYLLSVGASFILLGATDGSHTTMCDIAAIKVVNIVSEHIDAVPLID